MWYKVTIVEFVEADDPDQAWEVFRTDHAGDLLDLAEVEEASEEEVDCIRESEQQEHADLTNQMAADDE